MALNFPPTPSVGDTYQNWQWDGSKWVRFNQWPIPLDAPQDTFLYGREDGDWARALPLAGGMMDGPIVWDQPPAADDELANKLYVDESVASTNLWQGVWDPTANDPDLTNTGLQTNGYTWVITLADPTAPFDIPATPAIPGLNGLTVHNGDVVKWSQTAGEYEVIRGSGLLLSEAEDLFPLKQDAIILGVAGTYTQGTDFADLQTFLDESINNRWFIGAVTINVNVPTTYQTTMRNVRGAATITINTTVQIAGAFIYQDMGVLLVINGSGPTTTTSMWLRGGSVQLRGAQPAGAGSTMYGSVNVAWETGGTYLHAGNVAADNIAITTLTVNSPSLAFLGAGGSTVSLTTLTNHGVVIIPSNATNLTVNNWGTGAGAVIDNRTILARRDTFVRAATATRAMTVDIADLQTTINSLPKILTGTVTITVNPGTITTGITVAQFSGPGILSINGAASATNTHNVLNFVVEQCTLARVTIRGFNATATTGAAFLCRNCIGAFNYWYMCTATGGLSSTSGNTGFSNEESTFTYWSSCVASNKNVAFTGRSGTWRSTGCSGVNNNTAWMCNTGIFLNQGETAVGATTRYSIGEGGMIIDGTGTIFTQKGQVN